MLPSKLAHKFVEFLFLQRTNEKADTINRLEYHEHDIHRQGLDLVCSVSETKSWP